MKDQSKRRLIRVFAVCSLLMVGASFWQQISQSFGKADIPQEVGPGRKQEDPRLEAECVKFKIEAAFTEACKKWNAAHDSKAQETSKE